MQVERLAAPSDYVRTGNCGIIAVAMLAGVSHDAALSAVAHIRGRTKGARTKLGRGWKGGTNSIDRAKALELLGCPVKDFRLRKGQRFKLRNADRHVPHGKTVHLRISGHVMTYRDGYVYDQAYPFGAPVYLYGARNCIVTIVTYRKSDLDD